MSAAYLVQILVPKEAGDGEKITKDWFDKLFKELTDEFGGATSFVRAPGEGCGAATAAQSAMRSPSSRS
ncbi:MULTISPECIES: hypothetical protein [unclassified Bradyrhizobium]|uniref:hypothetical protein n=1 Tax=unclassified Bradyrhizobium TaxID=2631580 RepID=UPI0020B3626A|nr:MULTISPECIES: hypothetical protein [unclassified Bradyrhizobium]MCP3397762.1 hypothetical protein [Bradyrhizobium sp. CCGB20]MCP3406352.1 hypothetical protein [Bradyrhizobium sp. CCGB01]